jgi:hypothetical protein
MKAGRQPVPKDSTSQRDTQVTPDPKLEYHHARTADTRQVTEIQTLNMKTGVLPYPAYYMRSEASSVLTVCVLNENKNFVATASVANCYDQNSRLGGHVFAENFRYRLDIGKRAWQTRQRSGQPRFSYNGNILQT